MGIKKDEHLPLVEIFLNSNGGKECEKAKSVLLDLIVDAL